VWLRARGQVPGSLSPANKKSSDLAVAQVDGKCLYKRIWSNGGEPDLEVRKRNLWLPNRAES